MDPTTVVVYTRTAMGAALGGMVAGLADHLRASGHRLVIVPTLPSHVPGISSAAIQLPVGLGHAGAVVGIASAASPALLTQVTEAGIPLVLADRESHRMDLPVIRPDDAGATRLAVDHLVRHGHTRIGFVGATRHPEVRRRYAAFHAATVHQGLVPHPEDEFLVLEPGAEGGRRAARLLLAHEEHPTALVVASDTTAIGLLEGLAEAGITVPDDLAIVAFGNRDRGAFALPALSSVDLRPRQIGERAARLVERALAGDRLRPGVRVARSAVLVTRRSCGCGTGAPGELESTEGDESPGPAEPATVWFGRAGRNLGRAHAAERALDDQQRLFEAIFNDQEAARLGWLTRTRIPGAVLALWRDRAAETLTVVGRHGAATGGPGLALGSATTARDFPPPDLLATTDADPALTCLVLPVATSERDWGLLAVVWDRQDTMGLDVVRHWVTLLAIALDHDELSAALRRRESRYAAATRAGNDGLWEYRPSDGSLYADERTRELLGALPGSNVTAEWWLDRTHPDDRRALSAMLREVGYQQGVPVALEYRVGSAEEGYRWLMTRGLGLTGPDGGVDRMVGSLSDIDRRRSHEERLRYSALHDALTGLANRIQLADRVDDALAALSSGEITSVGMVFFDLDDFKVVNDRFGHLAGDELLREVGRRLGRTVRDGDTAARFGGDEFAVLVVDASDLELLGVAERIRDAVAEPFELEGHPISVTASIGVVGTRGTGDGVPDLVRTSDVAMYRAKAAGRGQICVVDGTTTDRDPGGRDELDRITGAPALGTDPGEMDIAASLT